MSEQNAETIESLYELMRSGPGQAGTGLSYAECEKHYPYSLPQNALTFDTVDAMRRAVVASGSHYFDRDAVRFFRGKTDTRLFGQRFWVESRQFVDSQGSASAREYSVAWVSEYNGNLSVEKLGSFSDLPQARGWARRLAERVEAGVE